MSKTLQIFTQNIVEARLRIWAADIETRDISTIDDLVRRMAVHACVPLVHRDQFIRYVVDNVALPTTYRDLAKLVVDSIIAFD